MQSSLVGVFRQNVADNRPFEIKDPTIVPIRDGSYMMYATVFGPGIAPQDMIGRFHAADIKGPWQQLEPARIHGLTGPEICAPQVLLHEENGQPVWTMYVQTSCFAEDGYIAAATSLNGRDFYALPQPVMTRHDVTCSPVVSVYDVSVSDVTLRGVAHECMVFSGYRYIKSVMGGQDELGSGDALAVTQAGCGDLYMSLREKHKPQSKWSAPQLILKQEDIAFHNHPDSPHYEWGLEGGKIVQLADDAFLLVGVCHLDKDITHRGTRQRVFFAQAQTPAGPFVSHALPIEPTPYPVGQGENGHPDVVDLGDRLAIVYQERAGIGHKWHLRYAEITKSEIKSALRTRPLP